MNLQVLSLERTNVSRMEGVADLALTQKQSVIDSANAQVNSLILLLDKKIRGRGATTLHCNAQATEH